MKLSIRMQDDQTFFAFCSKLGVIVNSSFNLRETIPKTKLVKKILRSLLERFRLKVTTIEESKDIDSMRVNELVGSLWTYEMTLLDSQKPRESIFKALENEKKGP